MASALSHSQVVTLIFHFEKKKEEEEKNDEAMTMTMLTTMIIVINVNVCRLTGCSQKYIVDTVAILWHPQREEALPRRLVCFGK